MVSRWECNGLKLYVYKYDNVEGICGYVNEVFSDMRIVLGDKLTDNYSAIATILLGTPPNDLTIKILHCSSNEKNQAQAAIHSQTLVVKITLKYY